MGDGAEVNDDLPRSTDATRALPGAEPGGAASPSTPSGPSASSRLPADKTEAIPRAHDGGVAAGPAHGDTTQISPAGLASAAGPAKHAGPAKAADSPPKWAARAGVPQPGGAPMRQSAPMQTWEDGGDDPYHGRSWLTPVVVGLVALLLLGALGTGVWLIYRATNRGGDGVAGTESSAPVAPATSAAPTAPAASSEPASASASASASVAEVQIPALRGETVASATARLTELGLKVKSTLVRRADPSLPGGRVVDTDPGAGTTVVVGSTVTLIVASEPASPSASASSKSPSASPSAS